MQRAGSSCTVESRPRMNKAENTKRTPKEHQGNRISMAYLGFLFGRGLVDICWLAAPIISSAYRARCFRKLYSPVSEAPEDASKRGSCA
jgi:hypothetical protein